LDRRQSLAGIPVFNNDVRVMNAENHKLTLEVTLRRGSGFLDRFRPAEMTRTVKLDELGTFVVSQIDGTRNVLDIINAFKTQYQTNQRETELSVVAFLKSLAERSAISIVIK